MSPKFNKPTPLYGTDGPLYGTDGPLYGTDGPLYGSNEPPYGPYDPIAQRKQQKQMEAILRRLRIRTQEAYRMYLGNPLRYAPLRSHGQPLSMFQPPYTLGVAPAQWPPANPPLGGGDLFSRPSNAPLEGPFRRPGSVPSLLHRMDVPKIQSSRWVPIPTPPDTHPLDSYFDRWAIGSNYGEGVAEGVKRIVTPKDGKWYGKNGKLYGTKWAGNQHSGKRDLMVAKTAKDLKVVNKVLKGFFVIGLVATGLEADYHGYSNRAIAKVGVSFAIMTTATVVGFFTVGAGGVVTGVILGGYEAHGGLDRFYERFSDAPRGSVFFKY